MPTFTFESPIAFFVLDDRGEQYDEFTAPDEVCEALEEDVRREMENMGPEGLAAFIDLAESISVTVQCNRQTGRPIAVTRVDLLDDDPRVIEEVVDDIGGQFSDGWGEGYEQHEFYQDYDGSRWSARFWNDENWDLKQV
jgi:hypothetical protein